MSETSLVPLPDDAAVLDYSGDPADFILLALERGKGWLTEVLEHGDIDSIVEFKARADAIRIYAQQKNLAQDAQLAATEIVRRSERALGLAIRKGQAEGWITRRGYNGRNKGDGHPREEDHPARATDFVEEDELRTGVFPMADAVNEERFEDVIAEAKAEKNLSRRNVLRKAKGETPKSKRPELLKRTRHIDPNRVFQATVDQAAALSAAPELFDYSAVDLDRAEEWISSLSDSIRFLTTLKNRLKKELTTRG